MVAKYKHPNSSSTLVSGLNLNCADMPLLRLQHHTKPWKLDNDFALETVNHECGHIDSQICTLR